MYFNRLSRKGDLAWDHVVLAILFLALLFFALVYFGVLKGGMIALGDRILGVFTGG